LLQVPEYKNLRRWADTIAARPAVQRGRKVNRLTGDPASQLHERHDAADFETNTQDKIGAPGNQRPINRHSRLSTVIPAKAGIS